MRHNVLTRSGLAAAWAAASAAGAVCLGCVSDRPTAEPEAPASGTEVAIENFAFVPAELSAPLGATITWTNEDDVAHTVSSDDEGVFDSGAFAQGETFQLTPDRPGTYTYFCRLHPFMKAALTVTP